MSVKPKKHLGQHFLRDENIARNIVDNLELKDGHSNVLEIGPGTGVLTKYLLQKDLEKLVLIDVDRDSILFLRQKYPELISTIIETDLLKYDPNQVFSAGFAVIGNFPYNISSQILFWILKNRQQVTEVVGMFQKEVAERIQSPPGNKSYGILSVLTQAFYDVEYLFTVSENVFNPPPKVKSGVIRMRRNKVQNLECDEKLFFQVVKTAFNQRRKTLRNALKSFNLAADSMKELLSKRAEELQVADFVRITQFVESNR